MALEILPTKSVSAKTVEYLCLCYFYCQIITYIPKRIYLPSIHNISEMELNLNYSAIVH